MTAESTRPLRRRRPGRAGRRAGVGRRARAALYWVDIKGRKIFRLGDGRRRSASGRRRCASARWRRAPAADSSPAPTRESPTSTSKRAGSRSSPTPKQSLPDNRFNDGKVDRARPLLGRHDGRPRSARRRGTLYRFDPDLSCTAVDGGYRVTNGPAFSPDGAHHVPQRQRAGRSPTSSTSTTPGKRANRRVFLSSAKGDGYPDGMTVDAEGCLWIAFWDGWCVRRYSPDGELARKRSRCRSRGRPAALRRARSRPAVHHLGQHRPR